MEQFQVPNSQQTLNYQQAFYLPNYQVSTNEQCEKKLPVLRNRVKENSRLLPQRAIDIMTEWYDKHYSNPYPTFRDCEVLALSGGITVNQVKQWFVNIRRRTQNQFRRKRDTLQTTKRKFELDFDLQNSSFLDQLQTSKKVKDEPKVIENQVIEKDKIKNISGQYSTKICTDTRTNIESNNGYFNQYPFQSYPSQLNFSFNAQNNCNNYYPNFYNWPVNNYQNQQGAYMFSTPNVPRTTNSSLNYYQSSQPLSTTVNNNTSFTSPNSDLYSYNSSSTPSSTSSSNYSSHTDYDSQTSSSYYNKYSANNSFNY